MSSVTSHENHSTYIAQRPQAPLVYRRVQRGTDSVTIPRSQYQRLLQDSQHLGKLKDSLLNGGLSQETLDILIYGVLPNPNTPHIHREPYPEPSPSSDEVLEVEQCPVSHQECSDVKYHGTETFEEEEEEDDDDEDDEELLGSQSSDEKEDYQSSTRSTESSPAPGDHRTVMLRNLPDRVTHRDIVAVVRGGALLHIYLRARERIASVSFVEDAAARDFLHHAKTYGLYMAGKRVEVLWNDRQFYLPPYVRVKINNGASRNIILYNVHPNVTEWVIRKDLEHIHNLIVITVKFRNNNAYISTNSVHNALFARSCMMSRFMYKGMKIGFYSDECAESLAKGPKKELQAPPKKEKAAVVPNRFELLSLDGADEDEDHEGLKLNSHMNDGLCWADNSVPA
ncbi:hypothetical protein BO70DRAFT_398892 [Aspergillus heteromorphus CBS 117.55]|uniref:RRM domain-containing protein n=1 Tax=Aspergillus heteromorphus CBS 117.55 TaxID=1448321 RepID=A0A317VJP5_9EURO|nr:uncharacterized protein BO70DRAFT_398892 [Aspergillus heteromorphus CBS 117.55]PWY73669.1 hypothetical protein BO70DRAFT_398892 [Aspergillus heteromorphus CBS 117.55]